MAAAGEAALALLGLLAFVFAAAKFPVFLLPSTPADLAPLKETENGEKSY